MATITKRKKKAKKNQPAAWSYTCQVRFHGKHVTKTFATKEAALDWARETEANINIGKPVNSSKQTLGDIVTHFETTELKPPRFDPAGHEKLKKQFAWWKGQLGENTRLGDINKYTIADAKKGLVTGATSPSGKKLSGSTVNHYVDALSVLLDCAHKKLYWIEENPIPSIAREQVGGRRERALTKKEAQTLRAIALEESARGAGPRTWLWITAALTAGARQDELARLTWRDISFERGEITLTDTKNGDTRVVLLHPEVAAALKELKAGDVVETHPFGEYPRKAYETAVRKSGLPGSVGGPKAQRIVFHTLRHTCATRLAEDGMGAHDLQAYMGWRSRSMADRYVHNREVLNPRVREFVSALL